MSWLSYLRARSGQPEAGVDDTKSSAYLTWAEWGPSGQIPRDQRLANLFPDVPQPLRAAWIQEFEALEGVLWKLAEQGHRPRDQVDADLLEACPWMNAKALSKAGFLVDYYAWHG